MARVATIVGKAIDIWGDGWDVRERRISDGAPAVLLGWPEGEPRGRGGSGGPRVIVTQALADHFERHRMEPSLLALPIGATSIKRIRRLLGHHRQIDAAAWWEERADDLADMTIEAFAARHGCSIGGVVNARHALFGATLRPAGWWRTTETAAIILADRPRAAIADDLGVSVGSIGRMRWTLSAQKVNIVPIGAPDRKPNRNLTDAEIDRTGSLPPSALAWTRTHTAARERGMELLRGGAKQADVARICGVSRQAVSNWARALRDEV